MTKRLLLMVASLSTVACAPMVQVSTPKTVLISNVSRFQSADALRLAEAECTKYGKHAVYVPDNVRDGELTYECKE